RAARDLAPRRAAHARRRVPRPHRPLAPRCRMTISLPDSYLHYLSGLTHSPEDSTMLRDAVITFRYQMRLLLREPVWVVIVMIQPLLYLALFAPLLEPITKTRGFPPGDAWQVFVPGLLIQLGIFGSMF